MKNKIICLVLSLVLIGGLMGANGAYAWFVSSSGGSSGGAGGHHLLTTGNVGYKLTGDFTADFDSNIIVPEDELLAPFTEETSIAKISAYPDCKLFLENTSSIDTQLRIKIEYGYGFTEEGKIKTEIYDHSKASESPLTVKLTNETLWSSDGGYLYYGTYNAETKSSAVIPAYVAGDGETAAAPQLIPLFDSIRYSGENTESSQISGKTLNVKVIFEVRQSDFVSWETVGTIYIDKTETV